MGVPLFRPNFGALKLKSAPVSGAGHSGGLARIERAPSPPPPPSALRQAPFTVTDTCQYELAQVKGRPSAGSWPLAGLRRRPKSDMEPGARTETGEQI